MGRPPANTVAYVRFCVLGGAAARKAAKAESPV